MKHKLIISALLFLSGCASMSNYTPTVDTYGDNRINYLNQDMQECRQIAAQKSAARNIAQDGLVGALVGGAGGAAYGALFGNPAIGAAAGAIGAGLGGAAYGGIEADQTYKRIFRNCLRNRSHRVLD